MMIPMTASSPKPTAEPTAGYFEVGATSRRRAGLGLAALVGSVVALGLGTVATVVGLGQGDRVLDTRPGAVWPLLFGLGVVPLIMIPSTLLAGRIGLGLKSGQLVSTAGKLRVRVYLLALVPAFIVSMGATAVSVWLRGYQPPSSPWNLSIMAAVVALMILVPIQTFAEELLFRGVLPKLLRAVLPRSKRRFSLGAASVVAALAFASLHGLVDAPIFVSQAVVSLMWAWLAARTKGVEAGAAAHAIGNFLLMATLVLGITIPGTAGIGGALQLVAVDALIVLGILLVSRLAGRNR